MKTLGLKHSLGKNHTVLANARSNKCERITLTLQRQHLQGTTMYGDIKHVIFCDTGQPPWADKIPEDNSEETGDCEQCPLRGKGIHTISI